MKKDKAWLLKIKVRLLPFFAIPLVFVYLFKNLLLVIPNTWEHMMDKLNRMTMDLQEEVR